MPALLKARPYPQLNPEAKVLRTPAGVNFRIVLPSATNRLPALSKARGPPNPEAKVVRAPFGVNSKMTRVEPSHADINRFCANVLAQLRMIAPKQITPLIVIYRCLIFLPFVFAFH